MQWKTPNKTEENFSKQEAKKLGLDPLILQKLTNIHLPLSEAKKFLSPTKDQIRNFEDIFDCSEWQDIWKKELLGNKVAIFADYDVDGLTSSEIVYRALKSFDTEILRGYADVNSGFGLNLDFVEEAAHWGAKWLVVVDCGSSQSKEVKAAQKHGMKVVVLDHHEADINNPADMHCNPKIPAQKAMIAKKQWIKETKSLLQRVESEKRNIAAGGEGNLEGLIMEGKNLLLYAQSQWKVEDKKLQGAIHTLSRQLEHPVKDDNLTGAPLAWIWGRSLWEDAPDWWWQEPLYLASLGLIADMGSLTNLENRAICRLATEHVPEGIKALADFFEEDANQPTDLIRTKAALNLAKRWSKMPKENIPAVLQGDKFKAAMVASTYVSAASRKDLMLQKAKEQIRENEDSWIDIVLSGYAEDAGQSGVIANNIAKLHSRPCIVFVEKEDQTWKFSARNGKRNKVQIGELIADKELQSLTLLPNGETSVGGHADVVSGACTKENIPKIVQLLNTWLPSLSPQRKKDVIWVSERKVVPERLYKLIEQTKMLHPLGNDNWGIEVSIIGKANQTSEEEWLMELQDGSLHQCILAPEAVDNTDEWREWKFRVKTSEPWWFKESTEVE